MCCLKKTGLIWLLIHYYYGGDAPPLGPRPSRRQDRNIALGAVADYCQNASASMALAFHLAAILTAAAKSRHFVNFLR